MIGEQFNGSDPLRPLFRTKLEAARETLLSIKEWLLVLNMDVVLREPLEEELQETRDWVRPYRRRLKGQLQLNKALD